MDLEEPPQIAGRHLNPGIQRRENPPRRADFRTAGAGQSGPALGKARGEFPVGGGMQPFVQRLQDALKVSAEEGREMEP